MRYELQMPADTIKLAVNGMLTSFDVEEAYRKANMVPPEPEKPA
jgi:hypothetical protein